MRSRLRGVVVVAVCSIVLCTACGGGSTLGAKGLAQESKAVQSLAAEGALLAEDSVAGRSTGIYRREHSSELAKAASQAESSLTAKRTTPALEPQLRTLRAVIAQVRAGLEHLGGASADEQRVLARQFAAAALRSERIGAELG